MLEIIDLNERDKQQFIDMCWGFYNSPAVAHAIDREKIIRTADEAIKGNPFMRCLSLISDGVYAGYVLLAFTYSNEAGGIVVWIDEICVKDEFRGKGIGSALFDWLHETYDGTVARYRLEVSEDNHRVCALYGRQGFEPLPYMQMIIDL